VVAVAAPVPAHADLILAAVAAGKHVLTEWPITPGTQQTAKVADAVVATGVRGAVGLQARRDPAVLRAGELIASGAVGRVLTVSVYSTTAGFGTESAGQ
jgi:predicted dehydrogenase